MSCELWQSKIDAYLDAELAPGDLAQLDSHLRTCPACAADALRGVQLKRMTYTAGKRYTASPEFRKKILRQIQAKPTAARWNWLRVPQFAAAAAVVAIVFLLWNQNMRQHESQQALTQLADMHVATLASANPVDVISTDRHTVKPWFQGKLPFSFNIPELQGTPFTLVGGRMAYLEHAPAAQLLFQYQQHRISVYVAQETPELEREFGRAARTRQLSFNFEYWESNGLCYMAVGDAEAANIDKLATLLKQAATRT